MIRFLERNGYDASYTSQADVAANAALLLNHKVISPAGTTSTGRGASERTSRRRATPA